MTANPLGFCFLDAPERIFNCDETGMEYDTISRHVCAEKGVKFVPAHCRGNHERVSVLVCVNAAGTNTIPHLLIYTSASGKVPANVQDGADENVMFRGQKSGWMTKDIYLDWFQSQFLKFAPKSRPLILLFDGLKSHITLDLIECAEKNKIILYCLPPHSSHVLQPLDVSVFGPLKSGWKRVAATMHHFTGRVVNVYNFARLFKMAWNTAIDAEVISSGFKRVGIYPFDRSRVNIPSTSSSSTSSPSTSSTTLSVASSSSDPASTLADICILPERKIQERKRALRIDPGGKCLNYDFLEELRQDTATKNRLTAEKEARQAEREKKKAEKKSKNGKQPACKRTPVLPTRDCTPDEDRCEECGEAEDDGEEEVKWIACDKCDGWYHLSCTYCHDQNASFTCKYCR